MNFPICVSLARESSWFCRKFNPFETNATQTAAIRRQAFA